MPQIQGHNTETGIRGEWYSFRIAVAGRQYPIKLETKRQDMIDAALAAGTQVAVWTYTESEGGPNPHKPGTNYVNRYLDGVEVGGQLQVASQAAPVTQAPVAGAAPVVQQGAAPVVTSSGGEDDPARRMSIERQVIVKAAMPLYPVGAIGDEPSLFALMRRLDAFISGETHPRNQPGYAASHAAPGAAPVSNLGDPGPDVPPDPDDDIPF